VKVEVERECGGCGGNTRGFGGVGCGSRCSVERGYGKRRGGVGVGVEKRRGVGVEKRRGGVGVEKRRGVGVEKRRGGVVEKR
jgi:hypothetical protein